MVFHRIKLNYRVFSACPFHLLLPNLFLFTYICFLFLDLLLFVTPSLKVLIFSLASSCTFVSCIIYWFKYPSANFITTHSQPDCLKSIKLFMSQGYWWQKKLQKLEKLQKVPAWKIVARFWTGSRMCLWLGSANLFRSFLILIGQDFHFDGLAEASMLPFIL